MSRRTFPNGEMDQLATAVRQVARMLWSVHVCLQMGFEEEVNHACCWKHLLQDAVVHLKL